MSTTESGGYSDIENAAFRARYASVFQPAGWSGRILAAAALALMVFGLWHLGFSATRFVNGLGSLGKLIVLMFPPEWGTTTTLLRFLKSLGETVAIALLGTLLAASLALPLSLIAARNTTVSQMLRFFTRRVFDTLRGVDTLGWALVWITWSASGHLPVCSPSPSPTSAHWESCSPKRSRPRTRDRWRG